MTMTPDAALDKLNKQYKRQNEHIKDNYDRVSATLPKGTKERIKQLTGGQSCNSFINVVVREKLEELERAAKESLKELNISSDDMPDFMT